MTSEQVLELKRRMESRAEVAARMLLKWVQRAVTGVNPLFCRETVKDKEIP